MTCCWFSSCPICFFVAFGISSWKFSQYASPGILYRYNTVMIRSGEFPSSCPSGDQHHPQGCRVHDWSVTKFGASGSQGGRRRSRFRKVMGETQGGLGYWKEWLVVKWAACTLNNAPKLLIYLIYIYTYTSISNHEFSFGDLFFWMGTKIMSSRWPDVPKSPTKSEIPND